MGTRNISIKDEAYDKLKSLRIKDESFSDVIIRLLNQFGNIMESYGTGHKTKDEYVCELKEIEKFRYNMDEGREL